MAKPTAIMVFIEKELSQAEIDKLANRICDTTIPEVLDIDEDLEVSAWGRVLEEGDQPVIYVP